jgi:hypothetical protein
MNRRTGPRRVADTEKRLAVYDGRDCIGEIEERGRGRIVAYAIDKRGRVEIGEFANRIDAVDAVSRVRG